MDPNQGKIKTNEMCRWSLLIPLAAWGLTAIGVVMSHGDRIVAGLFGLVFLAAIVTGIVLAIVGLMETRGAQAPCGRGMAWSALCVIGFLFVMMVVGAASGVRKARALTMQGANGHVEGNRIINTNLNFTLEMPRWPWKTVDPKRTVKDASAVFMRENPEILYYLIAEAATEDWDSQRILEVSQGHLKSSFTSVKFSPAQKVRLGGVDGFQFETTADYGLKKIFGVHWCGVKNGFIYQMAVRGSVDPAAVRRETTDMFRRFAQFNMLQRAEQNLARVAPFHSQGFHYSIDLSSDNWRPWLSMAQNLEGAEFGAQKRGKAYLGIIPVHLQGEDVPMETLGNALAERFEIHLTDPIVHDLKTDTNFISFRFERTIDGRPCSYVGRVTKAGGAGLFQLGWWTSEQSDLEGEVLNALQKLKVEDGAGLDLLVSKSGIEKTSAKVDMFANEGQGLIYNALGLEEARAHNWKGAINWFKYAAQYRPHDAAVAGNVLFTYKRLSVPEEALKYVESLDVPLKKQPRFRAEWAWFLAKTGKVDEAIDLYSSIFQNGFTQDEHFTYYARLLADKGDIKGALAKLEAYLKKRDSLDVRLLYAGYLSRDGRAKEAVAMLTTLQARMPADPELAFGLAEAQLSAELYSETVKTIDALAAKGINSGYTQLLKGRGQLGLKRYREARECFELAAKLDPQNSQTTAYLDLVSGLLGQGNTYSIKNPISPVKIPEKLLANRLDPRFDAASSGAYYTTYCVGVEWRKGAPRKRTILFSVKIADLSGVNMFSTLQFGLNPLRESIYLNELKVLDEKGGTIATGNPDHYYVIDAKESNMAAGDRVLNVPVPGLRPGVIVCATLTIEDLSAAEKPEFFESCFSKTLPVSESIVFLTGDLGGIHVIAPAQVKEELMEGGVAYRCADPAVLRAEPMQVEYWKYAPSFILGSKEGSWKTEVTNYLAKIHDKMVCDAKTHAFALEKTAEAKTDLEKVRALSQAVQRNVRYVAIEFGRRGTIPTTPAQTLANGFGDCKDGATLLREMLAACGVDAKLALVKPEGFIYKEIPSLSQFTHMVVYVPSLNAFIDPAEKYLDLAGLPPYTILNSEALLLDGERPEFIAVSPGNAHSRFEIQRRVFVAGSEVTIDETAKLSGYAAAAFRTALASAPQGDRRGEFERLLARRVGTIELKELTAENAEDVSKPLVLTSKFIVRRGGARKSSELKLPGSWEDFYLAPEPSSDRKTPFMRVSPIEIVCDTALESASGIRLSPVGSGPVTAKFGQGQCTITREGGRMRMKASCRMEPGEYGAGEYGDYTQCMLKIIDLFAPQIDVKGEAPL